MTLPSYLPRGAITLTTSLPRCDSELPVLWFASVFRLPVLDTGGYVFLLCGWVNCRLFPIYIQHFNALTHIFFFLHGIFPLAFVLQEIATWMVGHICILRWCVVMHPGQNFVVWSLSSCSDAKICSSWAFEWRLMKWKVECIGNPQS